MKYDPQTPYLNGKGLSEVLSVPAGNSLKFLREIISAEEQNNKIDYLTLAEA